MVHALAGSNEARIRIRKSYKRILEETTAPWCCCLIRSEVTESELEESLSIVENFAELAIEILLNTSAPKCFYLEAFKHTPYTAANKQMDLAAAVRGEEGDSRLDGRPIPVLLKPFMMGFDRLDGSQSGKGKIWSQAVVRVNNDGKPAYHDSGPPFSWPG